MLTIVRSGLIALALLITAIVPASATGHVPIQMHLTGLDRPLNMSPGFPFVRSDFDGRCLQLSDWVTTIDYAGTAAHLGRVQATSQHCTQIDIFVTPNPAVIRDGRFEITAANGDKLFVEYAGSFIFYAEGPEVGVSHITYGPMTIVGGTGRFAHATGQLTGSAIDNFPAGPNNADFNGWIAYQARDRAN